MFAKSDEAISPAERSRLAAARPADPPGPDAGPVAARLGPDPTPPPTPPSAEPPRPEVPSGHQILFDWRGNGILGLVFSNFVKTLLTLGIYRFWARTRYRQFIWESVSIGNRRLAYTGTGKELFIGFLIAIVVLAPSLGGLNLAFALIPPTDFLLIGLFYAVLLVVLTALGFMARFYARRYLLTRTDWKGLRGGQDAQLGEWMKLHMRTWFTAWITLGVRAPHAACEQFAYQMRHTLVGSARFAATPDPKELMKTFAPYVGAIGASIILGVLAFGPIWIHGQELLAAQQSGAPVPPPPPKPTVSIGGVLGTATMAFLFGIRYRMARFRHFTAVTELEGVRFSCSTRAREFAWPLIGHLLIIGVAAILIFMVGIPVVRAAGPGIGPVIIILMFLLIFLVGQISTQAWLIPRVLERIARKFQIFNLERTEDIVNRATPAPRRGEGMADALGDVGL